MKLALENKSSIKIENRFGKKNVYEEDLITINDIFSLEGFTKYHLSKVKHIKYQNLYLLESSQEKDLAFILVKVQLGQKQGSILSDIFFNYEEKDIIKFKERFNSAEFDLYWILTIHEELINPKKRILANIRAPIIIAKTTGAQILLDNINYGVKVSLI